MYRDEIIHFIAGPNEYLGKLSQAEHPNGEGWYRIEKPALIFQRENPQHKRIDTVITSLPGLNKGYRNFVDIHIPKGQSIIEIRVLDKAGQLYEVYNREVNREGPSLIQVPELMIKTGSLN